MLANHNSAIISKLAKRGIQGNKRRNMIMVCAVALAAFMMITVLTVGSTFLKSNRQQNIRMSGALYDASLIRPNQKQIKQCRSDDNVKTAGLTLTCAWAEQKGTDSTLKTKFIWCDKTYWNEQRKPALKWIKGTYPKKEDEVMISKASLRECGDADMETGSKFTVSYKDKSGIHSKEFTISGIYEGYGDSYQTYVSEAFYKTTGYNMQDLEGENMLGVMYLQFKHPLWTQGQRDKFEKSLDLQKLQIFLVSSEMEQPLFVLAGIAGIILITVLSGYLLVYNILYLSVSNNVRYYGLLQTVGMTGKQIQSMLFRQMFYLGAAGLLAGTAAGSAVSFFMIPKIVKLLGIRNKESITMTFHPLIYAAAFLLIGVTIYLGSRKPARIAGSISPVEAVGYTNAKSGQSERKTGKRNLLLRMAWQNMRKDKKKTGIVILSLALSTSVFLCVVTMIQSQGARTIASAYMNADMVIENETLIKEDNSAYSQVFDPAFLKEIGKVDGISNMHKAYMEDIIVPWSDGLPDYWMNKFYDRWMNYPYKDAIDEYKSHPEKFYSFAIALDEAEFDYLNKNIGQSVDKADFMDGKVCIVYQNDLDISKKKIVGEKLGFYPRRSGADALKEIKIAAMINDMSLFPAAGMSPMIIVSDRYMKQIVSEPYIQKLTVSYKEEYDINVEAAIKDVIKNVPQRKGMDLSSKIDSMKTIKESQGNMMNFGIGIVIVLAVIGVMNYINTVISNVQNRLRELAVLESIGMTAKQIRQMLLREGLIFAAISLALTSTAGFGLTWFLYQSMNYYRVPFTLPWLPVICGYGLVLLICLSVPLLAYYLLTRNKSVVERIRERE